MKLTPVNLLRSNRARAKHPDGVLYLLRIGYETAYRIGGNAQVMKP